MKNNLLKKLFFNESGATAIEYGMIVALIVVASVGALTTMSDTIVLSLQDTSSKVSNAMEEN